MYNIVLALGIPLVLLVLVGVQITLHNRKQKAIHHTGHKDRA